MSTLALIDGHLLFREGLKCLLNQKSDFKIVGETGNGRMGMDLIRKVKPDVALMGLMLPNGPPGLELLRDARSITKSLVVSIRSDEPFVVEAFRSGANGYVLKRDDFSELLKALATVITGRRYISSSLNARRITRLLQAGTREQLTPREHEILEFAAEGLTSAQAGARLSLSRRTVEMHRGNLMRKLGLRSTADLVRYAIRHGVITA